MKLTHLIILVVIAVLASCQNKSKHVNDFDQLQRSLTRIDTSILNNENVETTVYYFHATRRCATCEAVEKVTKEALTENFGDKVQMVSINREENADHELIKEHKINGQTLLVISGEKTINLTNEAFMYARTKPDKLKEKIKTTIESL